mgnify:CR=1 FL=1
MVSLKKTLFKKELSIEDLSYISELIDSNISLQDSFELLKSNKNKTIFEKIIIDLKQGKMIEEAISGYLPKQINDYIKPLLKSISFSSALALSLEFNQKHSDSKNRIINEIAYPCLLMFVSITVLYLFDIYGMDTIFSMLNSFSSNLSMYQNLRYVFRGIIVGIYYGILLGTLALIILMQPKRISLLYIFLSKHFPNSLIITYYSEEFVSLLLTCIDKGCKTKQALQILKDMKTKPIISFLAFHMDESLLAGESLKDAAKSKYYDFSLSRFIKIANYTNDFTNMLSSYVGLARERISKTIKKYTLTIQITTYTFIGIIVIFIYQILFVPMQALANY